MSDDVVRVYSKEELSNAITNTIEYYQHTVDALRKTNQRLIDDADAIVEECYKKDIETLKERLRLSYGQFTSQKELDAYNDFTRRHMHDRLTSKYNGGRAPYLIPTDTGFGTHLKVVCPICGESEDITDTEAW
jgi:hypothetical protein